MRRHDRCALVTARPLRHTIRFTMSRLLALCLLAMATTAPLPLRAEDPAVPAPRAIDYEWMSIARWQEMHAADVAIAAKGGVDLLFVGDSITEGWEWNDGEHWKKHFVPLGAANFGIGGDTTQNVLWRLENGAVGGLRPKVVVLLIGTNNLGRENATPADAARGVEAVVAKLRSAFPAAKIVVHGVFPCDASPQAEIRGRVAAVNERLRALDGRDGLVVVRDLGPIFLEPDGTISPAVMPDGLHLSPEGYRRWAAELVPLVGGLLGSGR